MQQIIQQLENIIASYQPELFEIDPSDFEAKPLPHKWSKKEILGHLIDSAQNNIRRFVVAGYEEKPHITYQQDNWVAAADYNSYNDDDLINLWVLINKHIIQILKSLPAGAEEKEVMTSELHTVKWLAADYNKHMLHHLHDILDLETIPYP